MKNLGNLTITTPTDCEIQMTRVFNASRERVFNAFANPETLKRWFGPHGWSLTDCEVDFRVGGGFRFVLSRADGRSMVMRGVYREIESPERSVHVESYDDYPGESVVTAVFTQADGQTTMNATVAYPSRQVRDAVLASGMEHGAAETYDRLAALLSIEDRELSLTRIIDAPREQVYRAWTEPELLKKWFAPLPYTTSYADLDVRPGGRNIVVMQSPEGKPLPGAGIYLEVVPNEKLVFTDAYTSAWDPSEKPFMTVVLTFEDAGPGKTKYTARCLHWSVADREAHEKMGFHPGWDICTDQLAALAASL